MHTTRAIGATATLLAVLVASGCGGSSGGSSSTSAPSATHTSKSGIASGEPTPAKTSKSSKASPASSAKPTSSSKGTAAGAPGVPEAARQHTNAGSVAFVRHYVATINEAGLHPRRDPLKNVSESGCKTCAEWTEALNILVKNNEHYDGSLFEKPKAVKVVQITPKEYHLFFGMKQTNANVRSKSGKITFPGDPYVNKVVFELDWTSNGWRTSEVQQDDS